MRDYEREGTENEEKQMCNVKGRETEKGGTGQLDRRAKETEGSGWLNIYTKLYNLPLILTVSEKGNTQWFK